MQRCVYVVTLLGVLCTPARADFSGFNPISNFQSNQGDGGALPSYNPVTDTLQLTNQGESERRSIFHETPQQIAQFTATFTYYALNLAGSRQNMGACFVLQNSVAGPAALGNFFNGLGCGGISKSVEVTLELLNGTTSTSGVYTNGNLGGGSTSTSPVNLYNGNPVFVRVDYDGTFLRRTLTDTVTLQQYVAVPAVVDIPSIVMGGTAYVGLSATTNFGGDQYFSGFTFSTVPEPATVLALAMAVPIILGRRGRHGR